MRHTRLHAARILADVAPGEMASEVSEIFDALGPQLNSFMSVGILFQYFRRKLLQFE